MTASQEDLKAQHPPCECQLRQMHGMQLAVSEQIWLELARALAAQGVLNADALAQRLEEHALRAQHLPGWFYGLTEAAQMLRQPSSDPDSLVQ